MIRVAKPSRKTLLRLQSDLQSAAGVNFPGACSNPRVAARTASHRHGPFWLFARLCWGREPGQLAMPRPRFLLPAAVHFAPLWRSIAVTPDRDWQVAKNGSWSMQFWRSDRVVTNAPAASSEDKRINCAGAKARITRILRQSRNASGRQLKP